MDLFATDTTVVLAWPFTRRVCFRTIHSTTADCGLRSVEVVTMWGLPTGSLYRRLNWTIVKVLARDIALLPHSSLHLIASLNHTNCQ
jgi:hypothetical protein